MVFKGIDCCNAACTMQNCFSFLVDEVCPEEWCVRLEKPENIVGMQGQLFSETILSSDDFHYMIFPRLLALAERSWHKVL